MSKFLDSNGVTYLWEKIKAYVTANKTTVDASLDATSTNPVQNKTVKGALDDKVDKVSGKGLSTNDYTTAEKTKLAEIKDYAEPNQFAFSKVVVGSTTIAAETETDSLTLTAGSNVTLTPDANTDSVTIAATDTTYDAMSQTEATTGTATTSRVITAKVLSDTITGKINNLDGGTIGTPSASKTVTALSQTNGNVSATFGDISITKSQVSDFPTLATVATSGDYGDLSNTPTIPTISDTYSGTSSAGMSGKAVKAAIDALDGTVSGTAGAGKTLTAFSQTDGKVSATFGNISITKSQVSDLANASGSSAGLMSSSHYTKLEGIASGAEVNVQADWNETDSTSDAYIQNKPTIPPGVTVDSSLSTTSVNPVQNKIITGALNDRVLTQNGSGSQISSITYNSNYTQSVELSSGDGSTTGKVVVTPEFLSLGGDYGSVFYLGETVWLELGGGQYTPLSIAADGSVTLTGIVTPTTNTMAANKKYVDDSVSGIPNASANAAGLMSSSDFSKLAALPTNATLQSTYATKQEIVGMYKFKGSVATEAGLPSTGQTAGDVYNIVAASSYGGPGANVAWDGSAWDSLGEIFSIDAMTNSDIDTAIAAAA